MVFCYLVFWGCVGFILYTYFGYPVLLFLTAGKKKCAYTGETPRVTLMVLAHNEGAVIQDKIDNCLALDYPEHLRQILVVTDGSTDDTPAIVQTNTPRGVELCHEPERKGKMAAIIRGMAYARGEIVVFSDANNMYDPLAVRELVAPFEDSGVGCTTGAKLIANGDGSLGASEGLYWRYESFIRRHETQLGCCTGVNGEIMALRKSLFNAPPHTRLNDDFYMAMYVIKAGYNVIYTPKARSYERVSASARDEVERRTRIVALRYQLMALGIRLLPLERPRVFWQMVSHKFCRSFVPFAMMGAFGANLIAVLPGLGGGIWAAIAMGLQAGFYLLALVGNRFAGRHKVGKLLYLPTFLVNSNFASFLGFLRFVSGGQGALWERVERNKDKV